MLWSSLKAGRHLRGCWPKAGLVHCESCILTAALDVLGLQARTMVEGRGTRPDINAVRRLAVAIGEQLR